ncbi:hypothetical protein EV128_125112 [Rhizobium azibense]|nr:hypothetical protein EV128_125112 [Rhizobium azibense]
MTDTDDANHWSGTPDPSDPDNFWIDDVTFERVNATTGARTNDVFVFGSNLAGIHGAGAARYALRQRGAIRGQGVGLQGTSYGIPTKDEWLRTRGLVEIEKSVMDFIAFARKHSRWTFYVTPIGCGLAGYKREQIKPMFADMPANCRFAETWDEAD